MEVVSFFYQTQNTKRSQDAARVFENSSILRLNKFNSTRQRKKNNLVIYLALHSWKLQ